VKRNEKRKLSTKKAIVFKLYRKALHRRARKWVQTGYQSRAICGNKLIQETRENDSQEPFLKPENMVGGGGEIHFPARREQFRGGVLKYSGMQGEITPNSEELVGGH